MAAEQSSQGITLSADATEYVVGGAIPVKLAYLNTTPNPVTFKEPLKTWEVQFRAARNATPPEDRPFGKMSSYTTPAGVERRTVEAAKPVTLDPGKQAAFEYDVGTRWPELFSPGQVRVSVVDLHGEPWRTVSNELTWKIIFTAESVDHLLAILGSAKSTADAKHFAVYWLHTLDTDFQFNLEHDAVEIKKANQAALKKFKKWWVANRDSDAVAQLLAANNRTK
ncbi:MAG: hypothetical protein HY273_11455 [Gammaproteobacteria bacterium]|nr:hypothetical protein [Gammaproteobacteria bacterium]